MKTTKNESNGKMKTKLINIGVGTETIKDKDKDKEFFKNYTQRNRENNFKFPNIDIKKKSNDIKENYKSKNKASNSVGPKEYAKNPITQPENEIPRITSRFINKYSNFFSNTIKKKKQIYTTLKNNNFNDDTYKPKVVVTSIKEPELKINSEKNISNINNIYNPKDYTKYSFSHSSHKNNKSTNLLTIRTIKNTESNISLNEEEKNCILNLLEQKTVINFNKRNKYKAKKIKKDEFKEFLKEILKQHKKKNINKVKKKIDINVLLRNRTNNYKKKNIFGDHSHQARTKYDSFKKDDKYKSIILRNEYLNTKINSNRGILTEELNSRKRNVFYMYRFKKNQKVMSEVEEDLMKLEGKIKESFDRFKKNIDDEPITFE